MCVSRTRGRPLVVSCVPQALRVSLKGFRRPGGLLPRHTGTAFAKMLAQAGVHISTIFHYLDKDGDGSITPSEFRSGGLLDPCWRHCYVLLPTSVALDVGSHYLRLLATCRASAVQNRVPGRQVKACHVEFRGNSN